MNTAAVTRKLIDIKAPVMKRLSMKAAGKGMSLKRYIESLLEAEALAFSGEKSVEGVTSERILGLIGALKLPDSIMIDDEKAKYILSK